MSENRRRCLVISDFNAEHLVGALNNGQGEPGIQAQAAPFGQVAQVLLTEHPCWGDAEKTDVAVIWTQPQSVSPSFGRMLAGESVSWDEIAAEMAGFCELVRGASDRARLILIASWTLPNERRGLGALELHQGATRMLARMNEALCLAFDVHASVCVIDAARWIGMAGDKAASPRRWYAGKIPYGSQVFHEAADDVRSAQRASEGLTRKLLVLDLDNTLWGGGIGDDGIDGIELGGHSPKGEAFADFQRALKTLTRRGIVLAICSKNEESVALRAIDEHPEMVLRRDDFVAWRINWQDKARNIAEMVDELNLGRRSVVFIDDNPTERGRVREALPNVWVPEWPVSPARYCQTLASWDCFDSLQSTAEDAKRTGMYVAERERRSLKAEVGSMNDWLMSLNLQVVVTEFDDNNLNRTAQLLNKTNQMNLSTRRMPEAELQKWGAASGHHMWTFVVSDRFGESGLTGIASLREEGTTGPVVDFILSCRVMGKCIEETMFHWLCERARALGLSELQALYRPTEMNAPCLRFWEGLGLEEARPGHFVAALKEPYPRPACIELSS